MKKIIAGLLLVVMCFALTACGEKTKTETNENNTDNTKSDTLTFFYTEDLTEEQVDKLMSQLEKRIDALGQGEYVTLTNDVNEKMIEAKYTSKADKDLFVSAFCINDFAIKDKGGNVIVTHEDVASVETFYMNKDDEKNGAGFLHFKFTEEGAKKMETSTSQRDEEAAIIFCLNGDLVNQTSIMETISNEMYASGFGNLLDLFVVCINEGPLEVSLYSTTALYEGQDAVMIEGEKGEEVDLSQIVPDGTINPEGTSENLTNDSVNEDVQSEDANAERAGNVETQDDEKEPLNEMLNQ